MSCAARELQPPLWGGFLFVLTSWPNPPSPEAGGVPLDKLTHFMLYAVEAFLLYRAVRWEGRAGSRGRAC